MLLFNKLLPLFVLPFGVSLMLLVWGLARGRPRATWAGVLILLISSNPIGGYLLVRTAEGWAERRPVEDVPAADAIVVLSAGRRVPPGRQAVSEWADANRFFGGMELFEAGKSRLLVFTGASVSSMRAMPREGDVLATYARKLGVASHHILVTDNVLNTADEAQAVAALLRPRFPGNPRVLLVTSAFHMPRARQLFERQGLDVEPFPVDFMGSRGPLNIWSFLPSVGALNASQTALREFYGRAFYWLFA